MDNGKITEGRLTGWAGPAGTRVPLVPWGTPFHVGLIGLDDATDTCRRVSRGRGGCPGTRVPLVPRGLAPMPCWQESVERPGRKSRYEGPLGPSGTPSDAVLEGSALSPWN